MVSIIIPTLNEEEYLPLLLESIRKQALPNFASQNLGGQDFNYEIIVADAGSEDKTVEIAEIYGCKVASGGLPPKGKNEGAKLGRGDSVLFVDADVILPENFLKNALKEFQERNLGVVSFYLKSENKSHNLFYNLFYNFPAKITEKILPQAMNVILAKRNLHREIGGFDEEIKLGEELDYIRRGRKIEKFGILNSVKILASSRRYQQDGWLKTWFQYFLCQLHMIFLGPVKSDIFKYKFNHYSKNQKKEI